MAVDERLVKKGIDEPREGLAEQGKASAKLAIANAAVLDENNWPASKTEELQAKIVLLESEFAEQVEARRIAENAGSAKEAAIDKAKAFISQLRLSLPECLQTTAVKTVNAASFESGRPLRRSPRTISKYLNDIKGAVILLDNDLAPFFKGVVPSTILDARKTELDDTNSTRQLVAAELPEDTKEVYEAKGRLLELIENLNRAGARAFAGDATKISQFNKDKLLAARKKRKEKEAGDPTKTTT